jgi:hypothetical protein
MVLGRPRATGALGPSVVMKPRVHANALAIESYAGIAPSPTRASALRALEALQPIRLGLHPDDDGPHVGFEPLPEERSAWLAIMAVKRLPRDWRYETGQREPILRKVASALALIGAADGETLEAINTLIGTLVMARLKGFEGGSISSVLGAIWIGLDESRPAEDFAELLVHEYVHNALFLEDMVHSVFVDGEDRLGQPDGLVTSAILKIPRGYDKAFHSAMVSVVLCELDRRMGRPKKAEGSLAPLASTLVGLREKDQFLTANGLDVLSELEDWAASLFAAQPDLAVAG